jgi:glycosyltransferase involved in cell wall biosynthesis
VKVAICTPTRNKPHKAYLDALERSIPVLNEAGIDHQAVFEVGCPYISAARATMTQKAMKAHADVLVYIDDDVEWEPEGLLRLIQSEEHVIAGTYRFKKDEEAYMGTLKSDEDGRPLVRKDGLIDFDWVPAGFLKVTREAILEIMLAFPDLVYGQKFNRCVDLFNHGAYKGLWYGEDYAFSRRWNEIGKIWLIPDLNLTHHNPDAAFPGNFHNFMRRQPGGDLSDNPKPPLKLVANQ